MKATVKIKPKRWWWPPDRREARAQQVVAQAILDYKWEEIYKRVNERFIDYFRLEELLNERSESMGSCDYNFKRGWQCSQERGHKTPCALRPKWWNWDRTARRFRRDMRRR